MAKKSKKSEQKDYTNPNVFGLRSEILEQPITETLELNYMPYAMSVIVSRAIPEIDGFKPSHRKLLYTMYKMGLLAGSRQKSANIVGRTMQLNPHGDAAIYETMVRLSSGNEALLTPFIDSKGNFGKTYSRDMTYAASRYTEAKLSEICSEIFRDIDKDTVDFTDSYDGKQKEPLLLPTAFPNILVSANSGIAVGMASMICGFNLNEVCEAAISYLKDPETDLLSVIPAPDFPTGGEIVYDRQEMETIYNSGRGSFQVRAKWRFIPKQNIIEIYEIPYTTSTDIIIDKIVELNKLGKVREINDVRDETDLSGLRIAIDIKRGTDPEKLMQKLFKLTTLQDSFPCNFNILVSGYPRVMGVREILSEWTLWRMESVRRRVFYDLKKKQDKLHLLKGLEKILLDIDRAIAIIRNTELETDVVPNLMVGFGIDILQAEFVAEIKLRNINREYILKRTAETTDLEKDISDLKDTLNSRLKIKEIIVDELKHINEKYRTPRRSDIVFAEEIEEYHEDPVSDDTQFTLFLSKHGYFKKITAQSLRMSGEQKYKEDDELSISFESSNNRELLIFTDKQQIYKVKISELEESKASTLGVYLPQRLDMDDGEKVITMIDPGDYSKNLLLFYLNGKIAKIELASYETKGNRKKLINAFSDKSALIGAFVLNEEKDFICVSSDGRALVFNSSLLQAKKSRITGGVTCMSLKKQKTISSVYLLENSGLKNVSKYRARKIPSSGAVLKAEDLGQKQMNVFDV